MENITTKITTIDKLNDSYLLLGVANHWGTNIFAGQFAQLTLENSFLRKPFSIFDVTNTQILFLIKFLGKGTNRLCNYDIGKDISVLMPLGNFFEIDNATNPLLIGGGCGIAPIYLLAKQFKQKGIESTVVWGERFGETIPTNIIKMLQEVSKIKIFSEDGKIGEKGLVTKSINSDYDKIFTCGPKQMLKAVYEQAKVPVIISLEEYMACGIGVCMGCVVELKDGSYQRVCKDGPVFQGSQLW